MLTDEQAQALQAADLTYREAKVLYEHARIHREREIRRVAAEGGTYRAIAAASSVAYQRVAQIVSGKEPPYRDRDDHLRYDCPKCGAERGEPCNARGILAHAERHDLALAAFAELHPELG